MLCLRMQYRTQTITRRTYSLLGWTWPMHLAQLAISSFSNYLILSQFLWHSTLFWGMYIPIMFVYIMILVRGWSWGLGRVSQGDGLSYIIFNLATEPLVRYVEAGGYNMIDFRIRLLHMLHMRWLSFNFSWLSRYAINVILCNNY